MYRMERDITLCATGADLAPLPEALRESLGILWEDMVELFEYFSFWELSKYVSRRRVTLD